MLPADKEKCASVIGIIAIPGMMSGALLGGSSVQQAAKLQMILIFMTSSATVLASTFATIVVITVTVDVEHRIRDDRIHGGMHALWAARDVAAKEMVILIRGLLPYWTKSKEIREELPLVQKPFDN